MRIGSDRALTPSMLAACIAGALASVGLVSLAVGIATRDVPRVSMPVVHASFVSDAGIAVDAAPAIPVDAGPYALDGISRVSVPGVDCPEVSLIDHVGAPVPWHGPLRIHPAFEPSVMALEEVIRESAREVYGREPTRLLTASSYRCTTIRRRPERISEHALGNAIDLRGIELARADGTIETITVAEHWTATVGEGVLHARFFRLVVTRAIERGIFRGVIGPPARDHDDHLHFDRGPSSFVDVDLR